LAFKVVTLVGTRPEIIKLSRVIAELDKSTRHILVHSGQNFDFELNGAVFRDLEIRQPDTFLDAAGTSAATTIANVIERFDRVVAAELPDAVLVLGDTNSALGIIAAKRRKVPIFHMEAGNRCFDQRVPEEINRKIVDHVSDINLTYTEHARRYLLAEGLRPETVIKTGSPMKEILAHYRPRIEASDILERLGLAPKKYFLVSAHREENVDEPDSLRDLIAALQRIADDFGHPVLVSTHPRTRKRLEQLGLIDADQRIRFSVPLGFFDYVHLQTRAACVLSDSGTITEESSILRFPAVTIRNAHERPEGMDEATVIMCGTSPERVLRAVATIMRHHREGLAATLVQDYDTELVSAKVVRIILSYTDYVRETVWREPVGSRGDDRGQQGEGRQ
jgi:UDP-N-acetylglucosamine 2-epimerase (non-hydrolysing)